MKRTWEKTEMNIKPGLEGLKKTDHFEETGINVRIILKWVLDR